MADREHSSRKRAKVTYEEKVTVPLDEESDEDEDMDTRAEESSKDADQMTEIEQTVLDSLTPSMAADLVISFMVSNHLFKLFFIVTGFIFLIQIKNFKIIFTVG